MKLIGFQTYTGVAGDLVITCIRCGVKQNWNNAANTGWVADVEGTVNAFVAYYCGSCVEEISKQ